MEIAFAPGERLGRALSFNKLATYFFGGKGAGREPAACLILPTSERGSSGHGTKKWVGYGCYSGIAGGGFAGSYIDFGSSCLTIELVRSSPKF
jgi:hypothetical protein